MHRYFGEPNVDYEIYERNIILVNLNLYLYYDLGRAWEDTVAEILRCLCRIYCVRLWIGVLLKEEMLHVRIDCCYDLFDFPFDNSFNFRFEQGFIHHKTPS